MDLATTSIDTSGRKPRLLFFQWDHSPNAGLSAHMIKHMNDHVLCLSTQFEVIVVNRDCDYRAACDRYRPDMALFESGFQTFVSRRPQISNVRGCDDIPKAILHNADSWSDCRSGLLSDMDAWGIDTIFAIATTAAEYMPTVKEKLFVWPNFINPAIFRDYGIEKTVPVMLSGKAHEQYPWRQQVFPLISRMIPCLVLPAFDDCSGLAHRTLSGEGYARALNASRLSLTCGTMAREVVRKHFEIPGARACLVCEESDGLKDAGFRHMENCAFADAGNVLDVVDSLLGDPERLERITQAGYELVQSRHTLAHRPQIRQWLELQGRRAPGEEIAQLGPFGDLVLRPAPRPAETLTPTARSLDRAVLREASEALAADDLVRARAAYEQALRYVRYLPEAHFGLGLCDLMEGHAAAGARRFAGLVEAATVDYGAADPDPVDWAWFLLALAASGQPRRARALADFYPQLAHRELRRARAVLDRLCGGALPEAAELDRILPTDRPSVQDLPPEPFALWRARLARAFTRCGRPEAAARLSDGEGRAGLEWPRQPDLALALADGLLRLPGLAALRPNVPADSHFLYLRHVRLKTVRRVKASALGARLQGLWRRRRARRELASARAGLQAGKG
ncbi:glycosyltransferase [Cereibacter johrii]|uniref:glycosyltransferase n=1 Tax=Cereibacter johrii TaxID=445629 RepID=UPI002B25D2AF|nr:glycosyltransferase [Cereibacter johrii]MEA5163212.1 glycosyltransferase [Cereibacter johrii]